MVRDTCDLNCFASDLVNGVPVNSLQVAQRPQLIKLSLIRRTSGPRPRHCEFVAFSLISSYGRDWCRAQESRINGALNNGAVHVPGNRHADQVQNRWQNIENVRIRELRSLPDVTPPHNQNAFLAMTSGVANALLLRGHLEPGRRGA